MLPPASFFDWSLHFIFSHGIVDRQRAATRDTMHFLTESSCPAVSSIRVKLCAIARGGPRRVSKDLPLFRREHHTRGCRRLGVRPLPVSFPRREVRPPRTQSPRLRKARRLRVHWQQVCRTKRGDGRDLLIALQRPQKPSRCAVFDRNGVLVVRFRGC